MLLNQFQREVTLYGCYISFAMYKSLERDGVFALLAFRKRAICYVRVTHTQTMLKIVRRLLYAISTTLPKKLSAEIFTAAEHIKILYSVSELLTCGIVTKPTYRGINIASKARRYSLQLPYANVRCLWVVNYMNVKVKWEEPIKVKKDCPVYVSNNLFTAYNNVWRRWRWQRTTNTRYSRCPQIISVFYTPSKTGNNMLTTYSSLSDTRRKPQSGCYLHFINENVTLTACSYHRNQHPCLITPALL